MIKQTGGKKQGYVLVLVLVVSAVFLSIGLSIASLVSARYQSSKRNTYVENAILAADAGVTDTLDTILNQKNFTGYTTPKQFYSDTTRGKAEYSTSVTYDNTSKLYTISSTGYAYRSPADSTPANTKSVEVTASMATNPVSARVAAGPGGLLVTSNGSVGGKNLWVNGKVTAQGLLGVTGFLIFGPFADVSLNVANVGCGDATNYPIKCTGPFPGAGEPIHVVGGGIYGTVCANNQTTVGGIYPGQSGQGLISGCSAPTIIMPQYDRQALFNSMTKTKTSIYCDGWFNRPATTLVGDTLYTGSITLNPFLFTNCDSAVTGNVYIRGNLYLGNIINMHTADTDTKGNPITQPPIIAVEGTITLANPFSHIYANRYGVAPIFISFHSNNATCNTDPSCTSLSSSDLFNSVNTSTVTVSGDVDASSSILYSYFGTTNIATGTVGAAAGQRIVVSSQGGISSFINGGINRGSFPVGDAFGGRVRTAAWNVINYRQVFP